MRTTPLDLGDGTVVLPGNRWDLCSAAPQRYPTVSVVLPYYEQPRQLALVLAALDLQTYPADLIDIVVADDGSAEPPVTNSRITVVRQPDEGFRAAAARNLGVANSTGEVLCFLDSDTIPEAGYIEAITRLPGTAPDAVTVGRRVHADFSEWEPAGIREWFAGGRGPESSGQPQWLADQYSASRDLLDVDRKSYRWVISAVLCCTRAFFDEIGGFDASFVGYGGEDWEFADRALRYGAVLAHVPTAVAWHDGPQWADRDTTETRRIAKNAESLRLSELITEPDTRRHGLIYAAADMTAAVSTKSHSAATLLESVGSMLTSYDCRVRLDGPGAAELLAQWRIADPRISVDDAVDVGSRLHLSVTEPVRFAPDSLRRLADLIDTSDTGAVQVAGCGVRLESSRSRRRHARWGRTDLFETVTVSADDVGVSSITDEPDLSW